MFGWPLGPAPWGSGSQARRVRWKTGSEFGATPFSVAGRLRGSGKRRPRPGDVGGSRWVFVRVRHHGLLRLASTHWVSVARAGQVDIFPAGVPDRRALLECVARPRVVGLYEGVLLGKVGSPGVVAVDSPLCSRWCDVHRRAPRWQKVIPRPPCRLLPCVWPVQDSRRGVRRCVVAAGPVAGCGLGPWGVSHVSHRAAVEGTEDFVHKGRVCRLGLRLSTDGGLQLLAQHQRLD